MNARLRAAVAAAKQLPDETQAELAAVLETEMQWDRTLADPANADAMRAWLQEVDHEIDAGEVFYWPGPRDGQHP